MYQNEVYMWSRFDSSSVDVLLMWLFFQVIFFSVPKISLKIFLMRGKCSTPNHIPQTLAFPLGEYRSYCLVLAMSSNFGGHTEHFVCCILRYLGLPVSFKKNFVTWVSYRLLWSFGVLFSSFDIMILGKSLRVQFMKTPSFGVYIKWLQIKTNCLISWYSGNTLVLYILAIFCLYIPVSFFSMY